MDIITVLAEETTDEIEVEADSEKSVGGESSDTNPNDSGADSTIEELEDDEN